MSEKMKAVVYHAPGDIRVEEVAVPTCCDDELRIKIDACAVCGTDLKSYLNGNPRIKAPQVMGHEFTGLVETVGSEVKGFSVGDRIVMATSISCGECFYCEKGWRNLCANLAPMGFTYPGGMTEFTVIPGRAITNGHVVKVPEVVKPEHAALSEPLSCAVNSAGNCGIKEGDTVVVVGAGPMGIMNACVAQQYGAVKVIMAEVNAVRLQQAENFGFDMVVNSAKEDLGQIVKNETSGIGADVVIVAAPAAKPQEDALNYVRKQGAVCLFASLPSGKSELTIDSRILHYGEIRLVGTSDSTDVHVKKAVELISSGTLPADKLASHILSLDGIFEAYELMQSGEALRVVLKP
ncbi:MAG: alcohol dehydrogenase catalytic domain-containing protein [Planctomycetota bacterium]|jgi:L-iditol 2-dehydrogenase